MSERPSASPSTPPVRVGAWTTALEALEQAGTPLSGPAGAVVVRDPDGVLHDLDWVPEVDTEVEPVSGSSKDGLAVIRHSAAHVMAQAVQDLFPGTRLGIGPPIENGFYYDFEPDRPFHPRGPGRDRGPHGRDHQGRAAVQPAPDLRRGRERRAGRTSRSSSS